MEINTVLLNKVFRAVARKCDAFIGRLYPLDKTLESLSNRPFELHLELTNLCNADCIFCPYQFQIREAEFMPDDVLRKAVADFISLGGGSVGLTPIVGDALIDPKFVERVKYLRSFDAIDRIWLTTNAILLDQHGIEEVLKSGLTSITISTAGFEEDMYKRVYRSNSYRRVKENVLKLFEYNETLADPINISLALRPDRPLTEVLNDPDIQPILSYKPEIDFTWSFTSANGRITRDMLPESMKMRVVSARKETCVQLYNGPIVLPDGTVMACSCVAAMDATNDLGIGNILQDSLGNIWKSETMKGLRSDFRNETLNDTCNGCDMYRDLELYRTSEGRTRAKINQERYQGRYSGIVVNRSDKGKGAFGGG